MNINRYNYEEFFLLYVDNELDSASRKAVELFIQENPDLEEELVMIQQSTLKADHSLIVDKTSLFRKEEKGQVNQTNYEEFFVLYVDEELNPAQRRMVEDFVSKNPSMQAELELLMQTRVAADLSVSFPDKSLLFREERSEKPVIFLTFSLRVAIAAILLLAVGIFWLVNQEAGKVNPQVFVKSEKESGDRSQETGVKTESLKTQQQDLAVKKDESDIKNPSLLSGKEKEKSEIKNQKSKIINPNSEEPLIAKTESPEEEKNITHSTITDPSKTLASNETTSFNADKIEIIDHPATVVEPKNNIIQTGMNELENDKSEEVVIGPGIGTKNKLRGFFRKVTRVIGRTTNLPATENKSLLIGNLEIALK
ncbi:MAG TPA: hypothetical protein VJT83_03475 [Chitinophagaceae bacterium]|nr:hypothetical protein [Chitinophagaceae bacterium]